MERSELAIVIPAYNEEKTIGSVVKDVFKYGNPIVVNDCSTDSTLKIVEDSGGLVVSHEINLGYEQALRTGFNKAVEFGFKYIITFDADGQHDPLIIQRYIDLLSEEYELVLGIRPKPARLSEKLFSYYTTFFYNWKDPLCGMKGYDLKLFSKRGFFSSYNSIGTELAIYYLKKKCTFIQIPIPIHMRLDKPRFGRLVYSNIKILYALIRGMMLSVN